MKRIIIKIVLTVMVVGVLSGASFSVRQTLRTGVPVSNTGGASQMQPEEPAAISSPYTQPTQPETGGTTLLLPESSTMQRMVTQQNREMPKSTQAATSVPASTQSDAAPKTTQRPAEEEVAADAEPAGGLEKLGKFKITFYCGGACCNGKWAGKTCTGNPMTEGRTIAVDKTVIPLGTSVYIEGFGWYVAEDVGGGVRGNHIDIYLADHDRVDAMGVQSAMVYIQP